MGVQLLLIAAAALLTSGAYAHVCVHGRDEIQDSFRAAEANRVVMKRSFDQQATAPAPIRVGIDYTNIKTEKYCDGSAAKKPFMKVYGVGEAVLEIDCTDFSYFDDSTMKSVLEDYVMPKAVKIIQDAYSVVPQAVAISGSPCGSAYETPAATPDVDLQLYVSVGAMPPEYEGTLAYASACSVEADDHRPAVGIINFNPKYLKWNTEKNVFENDELVNTAVHEIHHVMGFNKVKLEAKSSDVPRRGKPTKEVTSAKVLEKATEYFQCDTLTGVEIEDEGSDGTKWGHWERRIAFEELMVGTGGGKLSPLTMAFMEDLGYYTPNYSKAIALTVGKGAGCGFIDQRCNTVEGGKGTAWFFDNDYRCSPDHKMLTRYTWESRSEPIPSYFLYDESNPSYASSPNGLTDRCPYGVRVSQAECAWDVTYTNTADFASYPGAGSRCFDTSGLRIEGSSTTVAYKSRCLKARCPFGGTRVEYLLGSTWTACPLDGSTSTGIATPNGFVGTVNCPEAKNVCDAEISSGSSEREPKASGTGSLTEGTGFSTLTLTLVFNGTQWMNVLAGEDRIATLNHIRQDVAYYLKTSSSRLRIRRITPTDSSVEVIFGVGELAYSNAILTGAFDKVLGTGVFFYYANVTYGEDGSLAASESQYLALTSFYIDEPDTVSLCGDNLSQEKCVTVIAICMFGITVILLLVVVWCVCLRNPFKRKLDPEAYLPDENDETYGKSYA